VAGGLAAAPRAHAQADHTAGFNPHVVTVPSQLPPRPSDFSVDASLAINTANADPRVKALADKYGGVSAVPQVAKGHWELSYLAKNNRQVALVFVDGNSPTVQDFWTGPQIIWPMARGYEGQFGHLLNAPYVWIPLALIFFFGLFDLRPGRLAHLDLLVLLSFGISHIYFNTGDIGVSVPLSYPPMIYLLGRMIWIGFKGGGLGLRPSVPLTYLAVATVFLCGFRIAVNIADSEVIDVGYAGVIGADRITHGENLYGDFPQDNEHGDTYGPVNYAAYTPFELAFPWSGTWDNLPSAHAAAIFFDLAALVGLLFLGPRLRRGRAGGEIGLILAFAWVSYPYTDFALQSNSNDALVAALLIWGLVAFSSLGWRAILLALAAGAKFTPLFLAPLYAAGEQGLAGRFVDTGKPTDERSIPSRLVKLRLPSKVTLRFLYFATVLASVLALLLVYPALKPDLATAWDRTIHTQLDRESPFSIWGQVSWLQPLQTLILVATVGFASILVLVPRQRSLVQVAALSAAVIIATELTLEHWFYLYIPWFFGMLMAAIAPQAGQSVPRSERGKRGLKSIRASLAGGERAPV
jgi:hypothetical protein